MPGLRKRPATPAQTTLLVATGLVALALFGANAWVSEDAHITIRTIDNFVNGYGLRWNVDERVQTYTHPLWLLVVTPVYFVTREIYFTLTAIGLLFSVGAWVVVGRRLGHRPWLLLAAFLPFILSRSFLHYSTSGFENPLTLFLAALFAVTLLAEPGGEPPWGRLALVAALAATNRLDTILLYLPALAFLVLAHRRRVAWRRLALGFAPLAGWLLFSLFYYGFPFPNTYYAKLPSAIPRRIYLAKGALYLADLVLADPVSATVLALGAAATLVWMWRWWRDRDDGDGRLAALGAGALVYCAYVIWIGGDFLSGRFWTAPVLMALVVCAASAPALFARARAAGLGARLLVAAAALVVFVAGRAAAAEVERTVRGNVNPRSVARVTLSRDLSWKPTRGARDFRRAGRGMRRRAERDGRTTQRHSLIGIAGVTAGPGVKIVDALALGDPLLARLTPASQRGIRKIGHLRRKVPAGYLTARETGSLDEMDPALAAYYARLRLITSGPLWSHERLRTLVAFNLGAYDHLREEYERRARASGGG